MAQVIEAGQPLKNNFRINQALAVPMELGVETLGAAQVAIAVVLEITEATLERDQAVEITGLEHPCNRLSL